MPVLIAGCNRNKARPVVELAPARVSTIGVNTWLWRAALETIAFMPIAQVDSAGGVIVTDWYSTPQATNERVKLTISILDQELRADALRVAAVREVLTTNGWVAAPIRAGTTQRLEELILTRARDLRRGTLPDRR